MKQKPEIECQRRYTSLALMASKVIVQTSSACRESAAYSAAE